MINIVIRKDTQEKSVNGWYVIVKYSLDFMYDKTMTDHMDLNN